MTSPYREAPQSILCPRCGEMLDTVFAGVAACPRCEGAWIAQPALDTAFGDPRWPGGHATWWHDELDCPECMLSGIITVMSARASGEVRVDACPSHGLWLDRGELNRLLGLAQGSDELLELQRRVTAGATDSEELAERRHAWQTEREGRHKAATKLRAELQALQKRRTIELAEEETRRRAELEVAEAADRERTADEARVAASVKLAAETDASAKAASDAASQAAAAARAQAAEDERMRERIALLRSYRTERDEVRRRIGELRMWITGGRADLNVLQAELAAKHAAVTAKQDAIVQLTQELDGLEARLSSLDAQLRTEGP